MDREQVAHVLDQFGTLLELQGENAFKCNAYHQAARTLEALQADLGMLVAENRLNEIKGIGESLATKITTLVTTGHLPAFEALQKEIPPGVLDLLRIPGLGPKKVRALWRDLALTSIDALEAACKENRLLGHAGFGAKTQENILKGIEQIRASAGKFLYSVAREEAERIQTVLAELPSVRRLSVAGSLRRRKEVVKDLDFVVSTTRPDEVMARFVGLPGVQRVLAHGPTKSSILLECGIQADLRAVADAEYPFALQYFTGSKEHNTALRGRARKLGLKLNEYGLTRDDQPVPCADEAAIFGALGLDEVPPELREDMGELEAAEQHRIPALIEERDLTGVFHTHTTWSDGKHSVREMAEAAARLGFQYLGISDHSPAAFYAGGLDRDKLMRQHDDIDAVQASLPQLRIFKGTEADILPDGSVDYPDEILARLDFVVASIHSKFKMAEAEATDRVLRALRNPYVTFLGHPTGRLLLSREGYPIHLHTVIQEAARLGVAIEINAHPLRLDLDWRFGRFARECGLKVGIFPDAHAVEGLRDVQYGVGVARKAWMRREDVVNAWSLPEVENFLKRRRTAAVSPTTAAQTPAAAPPPRAKARRTSGRKRTQESP